MDIFRYFHSSFPVYGEDHPCDFSLIGTLVCHSYGKDTSYKKCLLLGICAMGNSSLQWRISVFHMRFPFMLLLA